MNGNSFGRHVQGGQHRGYQHNAQQQQQQQHGHGHGTHHQQNPAGQSGMGHQHTFSGGMLAGSAQAYGSASTQHGSHEEELELSDQMPDHWRRQLDLAQEGRMNKSNPQWHSKQRSAAQFAARQSTTEAAEEDNEHNRVVAVNEERRQDWDGMDMSGQALRTLNPKVADFYPFLTRLYLDNNQLMILPPEIGLLRNLRVLNVSQNHLQELPNCIGMLSSLVELLLFDNQIRTLPQEVGYLYKLEVLGIVGNPIDKDIKELIMERGTKELVKTIRDTTNPPPLPKPRSLLVLDDSPATEKFTILDYNILCDKYATAAVYPYTPTKALDWDYRRELILKELTDKQPDMACLQEIDQESYNEYFRRELAYHDYKGAFWPKSRARTMADREAKAVDGCAIFFKGQKYILLDKKLVDFANIAINRPDMKGEHDAFNRVMPKDNIAVVCFFENRMTGTRMIVATAHLTWDPSFNDVKLVQTAILIDQITKFADKWAAHPPCTEKEKAPYRHSAEDSELTEEKPMKPAPSVSYSKGSQLPVVLCGDFNSPKGSGVFDFLTKGSVSGKHQDMEGRSYGSLTKDGMSHHFKFKSAYIDDQQDYLWFSNYTPHFVSLIDHIFHTPALRVQKLLGNVDQDHLQTVPGFPHYHFPSDHLALYAEFAVDPVKKHGKITEANFGS